MSDTAVRKKNSSILAFIPNPWEHGNLTVGPIIGYGYNIIGYGYNEQRI